MNFIQQPFLGAEFFFKQYDEMRFFNDSATDSDSNQSRRNDQVWDNVIFMTNMMCFKSVLNEIYTPKQWSIILEIQNTNSMSKYLHDDFVDFSLSNWLLNINQLSLLSYINYSIKYP